MRETKTQLAARCAATFERLSAIEPEPKGELEYRNPFTLLVAVVLSAQATDVSVNRVTKALFEEIDTPQKMLAFGEENLQKSIASIGLYRAKARYIIGLCHRLIEEFDGEVPKDRTRLESLPGVGRKTANVVLNTAFGMATIAVDTHLFRLSNRLAIAPGKTPREVEEKLEKIVPNRFKRHCHQWLILHGRYICKARKPECWRCPLIDLCPYKPKTKSPRPEQLL